METCDSSVMVSNLGDASQNKSHSTWHASPLQDEKTAKQKRLHSSVSDTMKYCFLVCCRVPLGLSFAPQSFRRLSIWKNLVENRRPVRPVSFFRPSVELHF